MSRVLGLARSAHPLPTLGVTTFATTLAAAAGNDRATCVLFAAAVFTGQLTVGWSNDRFDARADQALARTEKPLAAGQISARAVDIALATATAACIALSLALGWRPGLTHLTGVSCGWLYNAFLKGTWWSWLPYSAGFTALPVTATLALDHPTVPPCWVLVGTTLIGLSANLTNTLPQLAAQNPSGFRGLPDRMVADPSLVLAAVLMLAATALVAAANPTLLGWILLGITVAAVAVGTPFLWRRAHTRMPFYGVMALAALDLIITVRTDMSGESSDANVCRA